MVKLRLISAPFKDSCNGALLTDAAGKDAGLNLDALPLAMAAGQEIYALTCRHSRAETTLMGHTGKAQ